MRQTDDATTHRVSRLEHFPITLMPTVMGLTGLAVVLFKVEHTLHLDLPLGTSLLYVVAAWFVALLGIYGAKLIRYPAAVRAEFLHPIRINFFAAISICFLLLSIGFVEHGSLRVAKLLWLIGAPLHLVFLLIILYRWFHHDYPIHSFNPAWFIPVVGPILVPVVGVRFAHPDVSWFFFAVGLMYWIVLLSALTNRIFFHDPLPQKLLPTLFILIAPPAVGFISYIKLTGELDAFARILFYFGVFTTLLMLTMVDQFKRVPYYVSWWGYTFPLDAFTLSLFLMYQKSQIVGFRYAALVMAAVTALVIVVVLAKTLAVAARGGICVPED